MKHRSELILATLTTVVAGSLVLLLGELEVRRRARARGIPGTLSLAFYQHRRLGSALIRNYDIFGWAHVDEHGFRGGPVTMAKPEGVTRIMAVGGSTTFDAKVAEDENAWPARFQHWLSQQAPGRRFEVINAGTPSYRLVDNLIRLETELYEFAPDILILYHSHNDLGVALFRAIDSESLSENTPDEVSARTPWKRWLIRNSLLYHRLNARWLAWRYPSDVQRWKRERVANAAALHQAIERSAEAFQRDLTFFLLIAREMGICVVLPQVNHLSGSGTLVETDSELLRIWERTYPIASPDTVLRGYARYGSVLQAAAEGTGAAYIPTEQFGLRGTEYYAPNDAMHFASAGSELMGKMLAATFVELGIIDLASWCQHARR